MLSTKHGKRWECITGAVNVKQRCLDGGFKTHHTNLNFHSNCFHFSKTESSRRKVSA
jgi:hypothetical protein